MAIYHWINSHEDRLASTASSRGELSPTRPGISSGNPLMLDRESINRIRLYLNRRIWPFLSVRSRQSPFKPWCTDMKNTVDPASLGLPVRTKVMRIDKNHLALVKDRKSRIIMHDGKKILKNAETIWRTHPDIRISVKTAAPVCSKTRAFLQERGIEILPL